MCHRLPDVLNLQLFELLHPVLQSLAVLLQHLLVLFEAVLELDLFAPELIQVGALGIDLFLEFCHLVFFRVKCLCPGVSASNSSALDERPAYLLRLVCSSPNLRHSSILVPHACLELVHLGFGLLHFLFCGVLGA